MAPKPIAIQTAQLIRSAREHIAMAVRLRLRTEDYVGIALALAVFIVLVMPLTRFAQKSTPAPRPVVVVSQHDRHFYPDRLTIVRGTVVHITNNDRFTHHVYVKSPLMNFDSGEEPVGTSVNLEFDHSGTYDVQCAIHPTMHLWVTVK